MRHHVIISGTGRAGTTFLVQLLTALGLDTGFPDTDAAIFPNCDAGMEWDIRDPQAPYIVKSPMLCDCLDAVLRSGKVVVDHAFIPMRDLFSAAESRRRVMQRSDPARYAGGVPGGLWDTRRPEEQEAVLAQKFHALMHTLAEHDIPLTLLHFPRLTLEAEYLYEKLTPALGGCARDRFVDAFRRVARPELVNHFEPGPSSLLRWRYVA